MSTIKFTFEDLCAFFTRYPSRLMVGMIATDNEAPEDIHRPHIIIKENGVVKREYSGFTEINGDISLDVYPKGKPFKKYVSQSAHAGRQPFDLIVDIEKQLYPREKMRANPKACRARLHFSNGELYTLSHSVKAVFGDARTKVPEVSGPSNAATRAGLDIEIPDHGYAVLHFDGETDDFVFKGGRNYEVDIANRAPAIDFRHFGYFYKIVNPKPKRRLIPISAQSPDPGLRGGDFFCWIAAFGKSEYMLPKGKAR
jgi:hypothetical protein